ncbi:MAG: 23S rRNA (uracil(1939)-C(5))-methyltransferase RlmD [Eubacteriales bacterium]
MEINDIYTAEIIGTNENGIGITKIDSAVVFVAGAVEKDTAKIRIITREKNYMTAELLEIISPSPYRITDKCPDSASCGGCTLGHISYDYENQIKKNTVSSALRRAGLNYNIVSDTLSSDVREGYRNKISLHYSEGGFGYFKRKTNAAISFGNCLLCPKRYNEIVNFINRQLPIIEKCNPVELKIRGSRADKITVSIYTEKSVSESLSANVKNALTERFPDIENVNLFSDNDKNKYCSYIYDRIGDIDMRFTSEAFRQVNTPVFERLLDFVCSLASQKNFSYGIDLYCGSGIIGLTLAKMFTESKFWGVEINRDAVNDARFNAENNNIKNIDFFAGDAADFRKKLPNNVKPELITLDPPRAGLSKKMRSDLVDFSPERIIYISCNPQTMARDIHELSDNGYDLCEVLPVNMFPRTSHVETVCLVSKIY